MKRKLQFLKTLLVAAGLLIGSANAWGDVIETVGTSGAGDEWGSRKYSSAVQLALGETYHYTFTNTSYGSNNWNNWLLDIKASEDTSVDDWYLTMRSDNYGWGTSYNSTMRSADFVWSDFKTVMNGATVDMYINYNSDDKIIRTYATITKGETEWHYNFATKAIDAESVYLFLSEELAVLEITTAEKVSSIPNGTYNIYKRSITDGYGYTWDVNTEGADYTGWTIETSGTKTLDLTDGLKTVIGNSSGSLKTTINPTIGNIISVDANFSLYGVATSTNVAFFRFGNIYIINDGVECQSRYLLNGSYDTGNTGTLFHSTTKGSSSIYRTGNIPYHLQMEINTLTNKVTSMKVYVNGESEPSLNLSDQILSSYEYSTIEFGYIKYGRSNYNSNCKLTEITITETPQVITTVNYTVKFQDASGNTLKDDVVYENGVVGEVYQATPADMATFYNDGETAKYIYKSGQNTETVASSTASENVITLVFDVYDKTAYTVKAQVSGSDLTTLASGTAFLDGSTSVYWNKYINVSDSWYVADETTYGTAITTATTNVAYTATDDIDYLFEFEDMTISKTFNSYNETSASNGQAKTLYADANAKTTTTVAAGVYTISVNGIKWADGYVDNYQIAYSADGTNWTSLGNISYAAGEEGVKTLSGAIIPTASYIRIWTTGGVQTPRRYLDYMALQKTADLPATENIVVTDAGYATYVSNYNLDFSSATTKAYKVSVADKGVATLVEVSKVPAKTPVLLYVAGGNGDGEAISVTTDAVDAVTGNDLVAGTGAAVASNQTIDEVDYTNMILNNIDGNVGFYFANGQTVATYRAYLHIASTLAPDAEAEGGEARMSFVFDDETTGINTAKGSQFTVNGEYYNLRGQRVAQPTKGLYIVNGKKVVIK